MGIYRFFDIYNDLSLMPMILRDVGQEYHNMKKKHLRTYSESCALLGDESSTDIVRFLILKKFGRAF
jgi:hypothetical protein